MNKENISVLILGIIFIIILITRMIQNYRKKKNKKTNKKLLTTKDIINVLFNVGLLTAGLISILFSLGYEQIIFGEELGFAQPIINFLAGVLFIWFAIRNIFYGGKI